MINRFYYFIPIDAFQFKTDWNNCSHNIFTGNIAYFNQAVLINVRNDLFKYFPNLIPISDQSKGNSYHHYHNHIFILSYYYIIINI